MTATAQAAERLVLWSYDAIGGEWVDAGQGETFATEADARAFVEAVERDGWRIPRWCALPVGRLP